MLPSAQVINRTESKEQHGVVSLFLSSTLTARQTAFLHPSLAPASSVSLHPCASHATSVHFSVQCSQHCAAPRGAWPQRCRERGDAGPNVPASFSSREQHKRRRGEEKEGGREAEIREGGTDFLFEWQLAGLWLCGCSSCLGEPRRKGMWFFS